MKKKLTALFLAVVMCMTMSAPAFATENDGATNFAPILSEGETWHPANGVMVCEDDNCRKGHTGPKGWEYCGYVEGDSTVDAKWNKISMTITSFIPGVNTFTLVLGSYLEWSDFSQIVDSEGHAKTTYHKHIYRSSNNNLWHHVVWYYRSNSDGLMRYLTCDTYPDYL